MADFLHYVENSTDSLVDTLPPENTGIRRLHNRIKELKKSRTWEGHYMRFEELLQDSMNAGLAQGRLEERGLFRELIRRMSENGETEEIPKLAADDAFLQAKCRQYHLIQE